MKNAQRTRVAIVGIWISWSLLLISILLSVTNRETTTDRRLAMLVWDLFTFPIPFELWGWLPILVLYGEPRALLFLVMPFFNQTILAAPFVVSHRSLDASMASAVSALVLGVGGLLPWFLPGSLNGTLPCGFYIWDASFFLMAMSFSLLAIDD